MTTISNRRLLTLPRVIDYETYMALRPFLALREWDESKHPRDERGRFSETGGDGGDGDGEQMHPGLGYSKDAVLRPDGSIYTTNVEDAALALYENKKVELDQPKTLSTLIHELGKQAQQWEKLGRKAPAFNLCNVSVAGTNLFCVESKDIPRIKMPQMDADQTKAFLEYLQDKGYQVRKGSERASYLRATQNELLGSKVAKNMRRLEDEKGHMKGRLVISKDDYVLDGHHRWAAKVGLDSADGDLTNDTPIKISRVNIDIITLYNEAIKFTGGKGAVGIKQFRELVYKVRDWDEGKHPREPAGSSEGGRFAPAGGTGAGGFEFVSPNVENIDLKAAHNGLTGDRQRALRMASGEIDRQLGIDSKDSDIVGAWKDGAENSIMTIANGASVNQLRVSAAMKGYLADQKQTLIFRDEDNGPAVLYKFEASGDVDKVHENLLADGLAFHTLVPHKGGATVYVADLDGKLFDAVAKASGRYDANVEYRFGQAEFIGTQNEAGSDRDQRDDARRAYEKIIRESPVQESRAVWQRVHNRWGETLNPDNNSFARERNGEANNRLVDYAASGESSNELSPASLDREHDVVGFLTPEGQILQTQVEHSRAATSAGTSLRAITQDGGSRFFYEPGRIIAIDIAERPSEQQFRVLRDAASLARAPKFLVEVYGPQGFEPTGLFDAKEGRTVTPRDVLNTLNKIYPVMPAHAKSLDVLFYHRRDWDESKHPRVPAGSPEGGQFGEGGGGGGGEAAATAVAAETKPAPPNPVAIDVGGDQWNKDTALRLEKEYQAARPAVDKLAQDAVRKTQEAAAPSGDEDEEEGEPPYVPEEWEGLSKSGQEQVENEYIESEDFYNSEVSSWQESGGPMDEAGNVVAYDFNKAKASERQWAKDAIDDELEGLPYTTEEILNGITMDWESGYEGDVEKSLTISFEGAPDPAQPGLPVIGGPEKVNRLPDLSEDDRSEIIDVLKKAFESEAESKTGDVEPPDYLKESAQEWAAQSWSDLDDEAKFEWAKKFTSVVDDESTEGTGQYADVAPEAMTDELDALPEQYDPLNKTTGTDYKRTQKLAHHLSTERTIQLLAQRKVFGAQGIGDTPGDLDGLRKDVVSADITLWGAWKGSSDSWQGKLLQVATAEELGGRLNPHTTRRDAIDVAEVRKLADQRFRDIGGYEGIKAYIRAKWETTQFLLDKAGVHELELFRGIRLRERDPEKFNAAIAFKMEERDKDGHRTYTKLPTIKIDRNGAASTSLNEDVSNGWDGDDRVVIRASVPRTAAVSIPVYGINVHGEREVVIAGTAWRSWDAWHRRAPTFSQIPMGANGTGIGTNAPLPKAA